MERILEVVNGNYRETMKWIIDGETHIRRTNNKTKIHEDMRSLTEPICCYIDKERGRIEIHYEDTVLTLTNYRKNTKKYLLFREKVTEVINQKIPVSMKENLMDRMREKLSEFGANLKTFDGSKITAIFSGRLTGLKLLAMDIASVSKAHIDKKRQSFIETKLSKKEVKAFEKETLVDKLHEKLPELKVRLKSLNVSKFTTFVSGKLKDYKVVRNLNIIKSSVVSNRGKRLTVEENSASKENWKDKVEQIASSIGAKLKNINMPKITSMFSKNKKGYKLAPLFLAGVVMVTSTSATSNAQGQTYFEPGTLKEKTQIVMHKGEPREEKLSEVLATPKSQVIEIFDLGIAKEETPVEPEILLETSLEQRLENVKQIQEGILANSSILPIGTKLTPYALNRLVNFINSSGGQYAQKYGEQFGVDPYLLTCICMQESSLTSTATNGYAYGYYQVELGSPEAVRKITATNVLTGQEETLTVTMANATDPAVNTKFGAMMLQNCLKKFNNNIYLALQSYTFGEGAVSLAVSKYADRKGITREEVMNNYSDLGYLEDFQQIHDDPHGYVTDEDLVKYQGIHTNAMNYLRKWPYKTYGDPKYIEHVLAYYIGTTCQIKTVDATTTVSFVTNQAQQTPNIESAKLIG